MIYDYLIAGSGVAGCVCAYELSRKNKSSLILEKEKDLHEKVCGGGISYKAIRLLENIGMDIKSLFSLNVSLITGHVISFPDEVRQYNYPSGVYSLGMQRMIFDSFLLEQALTMGAEIKYYETVSDIVINNQYYNINGYTGKHFISAVGARGITGVPPEGQSIGISAQIEGISHFRQDKFYYWYYTDKDDRYFWIFPIGKNLWNIGVWFRHPSCSMKRDFLYGLETYVNPNFDNYQYRITAKAEFLGNIDQRNPYISEGIGDYAGMNNIRNGGGIIGAIQSAIAYADEI